MFLFRIFLVRHNKTKQFHEIIDYYSTIRSGTFDNWNISHFRFDIAMVIRMGDRPTMHTHLSPKYNGHFHLDARYQMSNDPHNKAHIVHSTPRIPQELRHTLLRNLTLARPIYSIYLYTYEFEYYSGLLPMETGSVRRLIL